MKILNTFRLKKYFFKLLKILNIYDREYRLFQFDLREEIKFRIIYEKCKSYTMTSMERMYHLYKAIEYVVKNCIPGDIVECGVWKGGSMMLSALSLIYFNDIERKLYLYDTYEGNVKPTDKDIYHFSDRKALEGWDERESRGEKLYYSPLSEVKKNLYSTGFPKKNIKFIKGKVEDTIPNDIPDKISILRLDTDWYESTYHELKHLFPRLVLHGILIIDDYGVWKGARDATDKYISENNIKIFLSRMDGSGRLGIKLNESPKT